MVDFHQVYCEYNVHSFILNFFGIIWTVSQVIFAVGSEFIVFMKFMVQKSDHFNKLFKYNVMFSTILLGSVPEIEIVTTQGSRVKVLENNAYWQRRLKIIG